MAYKIPYECICCGGCMERCPVNAIHPKNGYYIIDEDRCIDCGICRDTCPYDLPYFAGEDDSKPHRLRVYQIDAEKCIGCTLCSRKCPVGACVGEKKKPFEIDPSLCIGCGACAQKCPKHAISFTGEPIPELTYSIDPVKCVSCDMCKQHCHFDAIVGELVPKFVVDMTGVYHVPYEILSDKCVKCGACTTWCTQQAISPTIPDIIDIRHELLEQRRAEVPVQGTEHALGV